MEKANFIAQLWKKVEDYEGEVTLSFKISLQEAEEARKIPVLKELRITVEYE